MNWVFGLFFVLTSSLIFAQPPAAPDGWKTSVGLGVMTGPVYQGSQSYQTSILPNIQVNYGQRFFASVQEGVGYRFQWKSGFNLSPFVKYDFGRDRDGANPFSIDSEPVPELSLLDEVSGSAEIGLKAEFSGRRMRYYSELRKAVSSHEGTVFELGLSLKGKALAFSKMMLWSVGPELQYTDRKFNQAYFGISPEESILSGLPFHEIESGSTAFSFKGSLIIPVSEQYSVFAFAKYTELGESATDSPLISRYGSERQSQIGLFLNFTF